MKLCIIISAHKNFDFLRRLINKLKRKNVYIVLNIDAKADFNYDDFKDCYICKKRFDSGWGDLNYINSMINSLEEALNLDEYMDYFVHISGQDYPIKDIDYIYNFFKKNSSKQFLDYKEIGKGKNKWDQEDRYRYYHFNNELFNKISRKLMHRSFIDNLTPYGGANWYNINREVAEMIVKDYYKYDFPRFLKHTICMDEVVMQTLILNSDYKDTLENNNLRYVDWSDCKKHLNNGNPNILLSKDYGKIVASNNLFARKFDDKIDSKILDKLDKDLK